MTYETLDVTSIEDAANGIRRRLVFAPGGDICADITLGDPDALRLEPETLCETRLPERWT